MDLRPALARIARRQIHQDTQNRLNQVIARQRREIVGLLLQGISQ